ELTKEEREHLGRLADEALGALAEKSYAEVRDLSAELNGLLGYYGGTPTAEAKRDRHVLLYSDTQQGKLCACILEMWLKDQGFSHVEAIEIPGLSTKSADVFQDSIAALLKWVEEDLRPYKESGYSVVFNTTGGFKALLLVLSTVGMVMADEIINIFEGSQELLRIPRLPVQWAPEQSLARFAEQVRRMAELGEAVPVAEVEGLPEAMLKRRGDGTVTLSVWGIMAWQGTKARFYREALLRSPSPLVRYGPKFVASVRPYEGQREMVFINEAIDAFVRYLKSNGQEHLSSHKVKKLAGNPLPPSTHEVYAFAGKRIFLHEEDGVWVLDLLDEGLH
ncbi:MAG: putative CRISPR-associated protein, partial [Calditerricola sp.]|nr:putative CRISPR-associated protein [Calditerricola sp.]